MVRFLRAAWVPKEKRGKMSAVHMSHINELRETISSMEDSLSGMKSFVSRNTTIEKRIAIIKKMMVRLDNELQEFKNALSILEELVGIKTESQQ